MRTFLLAVVFHFYASSAYSHTVETFTLLPSSSNVQFKIDSALLPLEGKIERYTGRVVKVGKALNQFEVILDCDLSSIKFTGDQTRGLPISELLTSVKNSTAHFEGKPISQKSDGSYMIGGNLKWRSKSYRVSFPMRVKMDSLEVVLEGKISSDGEQLVEDIPVLTVFQVQNASANGRLVFKKLPMNSSSTLGS